MATHSSPTTRPVDDLAALAERVDKAFAEVKALDEPARAKAASLKSAVEDFHRVGLTQIVKRLKADPRGKELLFELVNDPTVYALFSMHGLVRADVRTRVSQVIENVRGYLQSHGGDVTLVDVSDDTVFVHLSGACNGCSMSAVTVRETVETALREQVPEIERVEVLSHEPADFVPLESLAGPPGGFALEGWVRGPAVADLGEGRPLAFEADGQSILVLKLAGQYRAYRNACAHQGLPLDVAHCDAENQTLTCAWHGWCYDAMSGECFTAPQAQLEQFPLRIEDDHVWVRPS